MSKILSDAIKYIEQLKEGLFITIEKNSKSNKININTFSINSTNIYFIVKKNNTNIYGLKSCPKAVLYFQNKLHNHDAFKNITVIGEVSEILLGKEFYEALKIMTDKYEIVKRYIKDGKFKQYAIYKLKVEFIRLCDYTGALEELKEII